MNDHNADRTTCAERPHSSPKFTGQCDDAAVLTNDDSATDRGRRWIALSGPADDGRRLFALVRAPLSRLKTITNPKKVCASIGCFRLYQILLRWKTHKCNMKPTNFPLPRQPNPSKLVKNGLNRNYNSFVFIFRGLGFLALGYDGVRWCSYTRQYLHFELECFPTQSHPTKFGKS